MERIFDSVDSTEMFDRFIRDYLTLKSPVGSIPNIRDVYRSFKNELDSQRDPSIKDIVADVYRYAEYFAKLAFNQETNEKIKEIIADIKSLKIDVAYPFLMEVYDDWIHRKVISNDEFINILKLVESYIFRRSICEIPTNGMNKTFATLSREIDKKNYMKSLQTVLITKSRSQRFPTDEEFHRQFVIKDIYNFRSYKYLLRKLENHGRKELVNIEEYQVEHIMPQNPHLSLEWQEDLGKKWPEIQAKYLHTIGNLTLTRYNAKLRDRSFIDKRDEKDGGFADSPLHLNRGLQHLKQWNETEIKNRAASLAEIAVKVWTFPSVK